MNLTAALEHVASHRKAGTLHQVDAAIHFVPEESRDIRAENLYEAIQEGIDQLVDLDAEAGWRHSHNVPWAKAHDIASNLVLDLAALDTCAACWPAIYTDPIWEGIYWRGAA